MGRRAFSRPRRRVNINLDEALLSEFQFRHYDPIRGKAEYGTLSEVINQLLDEYLAKKRKSDDP